MGWTDIAADGTRTKYYAVTDQLGSVTAVTYANAKMVWSSNYDPFGKTSGIGGLYDFDGSYAGHEVDVDTGLIYMWNRWQDPETGRFISEDSARADANYYSYVGNNPINKWDPTGLKQAEGAINPEGDSEADEQTMSTVDPVQASEESGSSSDSETKSGGSAPPAPQNVTDPTGLGTSDAHKPLAIESMIWPVEGGTLTTVPGKQTQILKPDGKLTREFHIGIDQGKVAGAIIKASVAGTIVDKGYQENNFGNYVTVKDADGYSYTYAHFSKPSTLKIDDSAAQGDALGKMGKTGAAHGDHLHMAVYDANGKEVDPMKYLPDPSKSGIAVSKSDVKITVNGGVKTYTNIVK